MKYKTVIIIWLFCYSLAFSQCEENNQKNYNYRFSDSIITYILINYNFIVSDIRIKEGEYLQSLLIQLNFANNDKTLQTLIQLVNSNDNSYDFAMALTKGKN